MAFPSNPNEDDIHEEFGRKLRYKSGTWQVVSSPTVAIVTEAAPKTEAVVQAVDLPMTGNEIGAMAYVSESNRLYVWNGSGWFEVALVNTNPTITDGGNATYELASDGTPTVITLTANDPEGIPITWSYSVTSGSLGGTTVSNVGNVFTITPSTDSNDAGTFELTFTASDGVNIDTSASSFSLAFGPNWANITLLHTLNNPNAYGTSAGDYFGYKVNISGNYAIVSAFWEDDAGGLSSGKAYIFNVTTGTLLHTLNNPNAYGSSVDDWFGGAVDIDGNYAIVGADREDDASGLSSGKAYIFNVTTGALVRTLNNPNAYSTSTNDLFGGAVAISGNYAIVGARLEGDAGGTESGKAYIFNVTTGALVHTLNNPNAYGSSATDYFGWTVDIDGNYAIVSAFYEGDAGGTESGKVYIFNVTTGALVHTLNNPNAYSTSAGDKFTMPAISGNYAIVGAYSEDDAGGTNSGKAYIFDVTTGTLLHTLDNPNAYDTSTNDYFGGTVSIDGNYAIINASGEDDASGTSYGKSYIYNVITGTLLHTLNNPTNASAGPYISGNYLIFGASSATDAGNANSGKAYIFQAG